MSRKSYLFNLHIETVKGKLPHGFNGSNIGNCLNDIDLPDIERDTNLFRTSWAVKKVAYGPTNLPRTGGNTIDADGMPLKGGEADEPFCYWTLSAQCFQ